MPEDDRALLPALQRPWLVAAFLAVCIGCTGAGFGLAGLVRSPQDVTTRPVTSAGPAFAQVELRVVGSVRTVQGVVVGRRLVTVPAPQVPQDQRPVVTGRGVRVGDTVRSGSYLGRVADRPVIALRLAVPPYRSLHAGDRGGDVRDLQRALRRLGHYRRPLTGVFDLSTAAAVRRLYRAAGVDAPVEEVPVPADPGTTAGGAQRGGTAPAATPSSDPSTTPPRRPVTRTWLPLDDIFPLPADSATVTAVARRGTVLTPGGALVKLQIGRLGVRARVPVDAADAFGRGTAVQLGPAGVDLDAGTGERSAEGRVVAVSGFRANAAGTTTGAGSTASGGTAAVEGTAGTGNAGAGAASSPDLPGYDVTVDFSGEPPAWATDGLGVAVRQAAVEGDPVLAVPLMALRQSSAGAYVLEADDTGQVSQVPVVVHADADGWVAVESDRLTEGDRVQVAP